MGMNTLEKRLLAKVEDMQPVKVQELLRGEGSERLLCQIQLGIMLQEGKLVINDGEIRLPLRAVGDSDAPAITKPDGPHAMAYAEEVAAEHDLVVEELTEIAQENGEYDVDAS